MMKTPDFYDIYRLDRTADTDTLGMVLATRQTSAVPGSSDAKAIEVAYAVLSHETSRNVYDRTLAIGECHSWEDLEYLGNFGQYPPVTTQSTPTPAPIQSQVRVGVPNPFDPNYQAVSRPAQPQPQPQPVTVPVASPVAANAVALRSLRSYRLGAAIADLLLALAITAIIGSSIDSDAFETIVFACVITVAYLIGFETQWGTTPGKALFGLKVRNAEGKKPTVRQSLTRNWWKIIGGPFSPFGFIGFIVGIIAYITMGSHPQGQGSHDGWANTQVYRK